MRGFVCLGFLFGEFGGFFGAYPNRIGLLTALKDTLAGERDFFGVLVYEGAMGGAGHRGQGIVFVLECHLRCE